MKPKTKRDFDHIRWYLMHERRGRMGARRDWYLEVRTTCRHLQQDNTCGIYGTRPQMLAATTATARR
ncbi:MAG: hypothetical protein R2748_10530 [Bryobacterales bacterium]